MHYDVRKPIHPLLADCIEEYIRIAGDEPVRPKPILPRLGPTLTFDFRGEYSLDVERITRSLSGFHDRARHLESFGSATDRLVVRFTPWGLSRLSRMPLQEITNCIVDPAAVLGEEVDTLHCRLSDAPSLTARILMIEEFLIGRLEPPSESDRYIARIARMVRAAGVADFAALRGESAMSTRQIERRFRAIIGASISVYARISRFESAVSLMPAEEPRLTDVGYRAGYYDQSHFIREFRRIADQPPGAYRHCGPGASRR
jgi:AraC-like DNA-binding protein